LSQVKGVLPETIVKKAKEEFAWLGKVTGPTRDLDVYLLYEENYRSRLPAGLQKGLDIFFTDIRNRREKEFEKLVVHMQTDRFKQILNDWHDYLYGEHETGEAENALQPAVELAREIIYRKYKKVLKKGRAINTMSPAEDLHRLRIDCKKLRYILEFFTSLFQPEEIKKAIKQLKNLQNNLGDFNDLSVQQVMLKNYCASLRPGSKKNQEVATAIGGLLTNLYHQQQGVRKDFAVKFAEFSSSGNVTRYKNLFKRRA
jgi:CHAD domain-containing protein